MSPHRSSSRNPNYTISQTFVYFLLFLLFFSFSCSIPFPRLVVAEDVHVLQPIISLPQHCEGHEARVNGLVDQMPVVRRMHQCDASADIQAADKRLISGVLHGTTTSGRGGEGARLSTQRRQST